MSCDGGRRRVGDAASRARRGSPPRASWCLRGLPLILPSYFVTLLTYVGTRRRRLARPRAAHRRRRADLVRAGGVRRRRRLHDGMADDDAGRLAVARTDRGAGGDRACSRRCSVRRRCGSAAICCRSARSPGGSRSSSCSAISTCSGGATACRDIPPVTRRAVRSDQPARATTISSGSRSGWRCCSARTCCRRGRAAPFARCAAAR